MLRFLNIFVCAFILFSCENTNSNEKIVRPISSVKPEIPGERNCFWSRGPVSADPYINIAYPDANVFYWSAIFSVPEGAKLELEGAFPHCRYMSLISVMMKEVHPSNRFPII